jgi:hypothetical protein
VIRFSTQKRVKEGLASGLLAAAVWLNSHEYSVDFGKLLRILETENPAAIRFAVHVENAEIGRTILPRPAVFSTPNLE